MRPVLFIVLFRVKKSSTQFSQKQYFPRSQPQGWNRFGKLTFSSIQKIYDMVVLVFGNRIFEALKCEVSNKKFWSLQYMLHVFRVGKKTSIDLCAHFHQQSRAAQHNCHSNHCNRAIKTTAIVQSQTYESSQSNPRPTNCHQVLMAQPYVIP